MKLTPVHLPPTLSPPSLRALLCGLDALFRPGAYAGEVQRQLAGAFPTAEPVLFGTGRAALSSALTIAMRATGRDVVVLPAFTSFSVAAAASHAGARVRLCDLDPETLDFRPSDLEACVDGRTAAVVLGNLFGYPSSARAPGWFRERGVILIDDAAQAIGAVAGNRPVGWRGDLGVLSFGRGKCVTTGDGGVLLVRTERLKGFIDAIRPAPGRRGVREWLMALAVRACVQPMAFNLLSRVPGTRIGESRYEPDFAVRGESAAIHGLAVDLAQAVGRELARRRGTARRWSRVLGRGCGVRMVTPGPDRAPAYLRFPVFTPDARARAHYLDGLERAGFGHVVSYPNPLSELSEFCRDRVEERPTPGATAISQTVIALPCHTGIESRDMDRAANVLGRAKSTSGPMRSRIPVRGPRHSRTR